VDVFPTALHATGVELAPEDADLPGLSLIDLANEDGRRSRIAFSEYHSSMSASASFMVRDDRYKLIHYVGMASQVFDLETDPDESHNLADDPAHSAMASQMERVEAVGGAEAIVKGGVKFTHSPPPAEFVH
jgi:choline-sulfatase